jgi:hypothetical protein
MRTLRLPANMPAFDQPPASVSAGFPKGRAAPHCSQAVSLSGVVTQSVCRISFDKLNRIVSPSVRAAEKAGRGGLLTVPIAI